MGAQKLFSDIPDSNVLLAGPGSTKKQVSKQSANIDLLVGCETKLWEKYISLVHQLKEQSLDGTLAEVLGLPVLGWRVQSQTATLERGRRDIEDDYSEYEMDYEDLYDDDDGITTIIPRVETTTTTTTQKPTTTQEATENHPHRHHHGEIPSLNDDLEEDLSFTDDDDLFISTTIPTTTVKVATTVKEVQHTTVPDSYYTNYDDYDDDDDYEGMFLFELCLFQSFN